MGNIKWSSFLLGVLLGWFLPMLLGKFNLKG